MADIVQTAGSVLAATGSKTKPVTWGEDVTQGMPVYKHTDLKHYKALNDSAAHANAEGVALNAGSAGQPGDIVTEGDVNLGATLTVGETYYVSNTAGKIAPSADIGAAEFVTALGVAKSASLLVLDPAVAGVAHA